VDFAQIIERWGFPAAFAVWLMWTHTRELQQIRAQLQKLAIINAVILKTLDVPDATTTLSMGTTSEGGK